MTWYERAACRAAIARGEAQPGDWFAERGDLQAVHRARLICETCPVTAECLDAAGNSEFGIWGGLTAKERTRGPRPCARCKEVLVPRRARYCRGCAAEMIRANKAESRRRLSERAS